MANRLTMRASIPPDVLLQELQGESVLLNLSSGRYFGLNGVGTRMWQTGSVTTVSVPWPTRTS